MIIFIKFYSSSKADGPVEKICKYFINTGCCPKENCSYVHKDDRASKQQYQFIKNKQQKSTAIRNSKTDEIELGHENESSTELTSRHARARIFAKWLANKFPKINNSENGISRKTVIYDVAGGKGEIAFELCVRQKHLFDPNINCTIVDPRKPNKFDTGAVPRWQRKLIKVRSLIMSYFYV